MKLITHSWNGSEIAIYKDENNFGLFLLQTQEMLLFRAMFKT